MVSRHAEKTLVGGFLEPGTKRQTQLTLLVVRIGRGTNIHLAGRGGECGGRGLKYVCFPVIRDTFVFDLPIAIEMTGLVRGKRLM